MKKLNKEQLTREMIEKAMKCENADELLKLAEDEGHEMTRDEAEAYIAELADFELDEEQLKAAAGGNFYRHVKKGVENSVKLAKKNGWL